MRLEAVIFDLNGTVLDDENNYKRAFSSVLRKHKADQKKIRNHKRGIGVRENWLNYKKLYNLNPNVSIKCLIEETQNAYLSQITNIKLRLGFSELIKLLKDNGIKTALATSNTKNVVESLSKKFKFSNYFDVIVTSGDVSINKPSPEIFILVTKLLNIDPACCLVFEDSLSGITAAKACGMKVVAIQSPETNGLDVKKIIDFHLIDYNYLKIL